MPNKLKLWLDPNRLASSLPARLAASRLLRLASGLLLALRLLREALTHPRCESGEASGLHAVSDAHGALRRALLERPRCLRDEVTEGLTVFLRRPLQPMLPPTDGADPSLDAEWVFEAATAGGTVSKDGVSCCVRCVHLLSPLPFS